MIDLSFSLKHMAWANEKFFTELSTLPIECLQATYANAEWNVSHIASHIVGGNHWYLYLLTGTEGGDYPEPKNADDVLKLREYLKKQDAQLLEEAASANAEITFDGYTGKEVTSREMVLHQAVYHATEHRTQIATAIEVQGMAKIDLDAYDFWSFNFSQKS